MDFADGCKVQTKHRVGGDQHVDLARQLPCQHGTLHIATRQAANRCVRALRFDAVVGNPVACATAPERKPQYATHRQRWLVKITQRHVVGHRQVANAGVAQWLFWQAAHLEAAIFFTRGGIGFTHHADPARQAPALAHQGFYKLALAIA